MRCQDRPHRALSTYYTHHSAHHIMSALEQFVELTGCTQDQAQFYLDSSKGDLQVSTLYIQHIHTTVQVIDSLLLSCSVCCVQLL